MICSMPERKPYFSIYVIPKSSKILKQGRMNGFGKGWGRDGGSDEFVKQHSKQ